MLGWNANLRILVKMGLKTLVRDSLRNFEIFFAACPKMKCRFFWFTARYQCVCVGIWMSFFLCFVSRDVHLVVVQSNCTEIKFVTIFACFHLFSLIICFAFVSKLPFLFAETDFFKNLISKWKHKTWVLWWYLNKKVCPSASNFRFYLNKLPFKFQSFPFED